MRKFTEEEKELIINTEITELCFDFDYTNGFNREYALDNGCIVYSLKLVWSDLLESLNFMRKDYIKTKDERIFTELVRLLPASYKVVKL